MQWVEIAPKRRKNREIKEWINYRSHAAWFWKGNKKAANLWAGEKKPKKY